MVAREACIMNLFLMRGAAVMLALLAVGRMPCTTAAESAPPRAEAGRAFDPRPLVNRAERAGLRVFQSRHLVLITDRPPRQGDGLAELPAIFDEAFGVWCGHYGLDPASLAQWRACGCLVVDRETFRAAGLLPATVPEFANGYCDHHRFWLADQSNPAYRRHLLLHEGVHAFTATLRNLNTPTWYTEGIAEWLATHRLESTAPRFRHTPLPASPEDVEQLGRIEMIRRLRAAGEGPSLDDVFSLRPTLHGTISSYAAAWAGVSFLADHPRYAEAFATIERGPLDAALTQRLRQQPSWNPAAASRDFDAFTDTLDYGYDLSRMVIDWAPGQPVPAAGAVTHVQAERGWQHSGWQVQAGRAYQLQASGRVRVGRLRQDSGTLDLESTADGISIDWYRGRPIGRLLAAQWDDHPQDGGRPRFTVLGEGEAITITAAATGPLYVKINNPPANLPDAGGSLAVQLVSVSSSDPEKAESAPRR